MCGLSHPLRQGLGAREIEHLPTARHWIEPVGEVGHLAIRLKKEWERTPNRRQVVRQAGRILCRLRLDAGERAFRLGLDSARGLSIDVEEIICESKSGFHREFARRNAATGCKIEFVPILDDPTARS